MARLVDTFTFCSYPLIQAWADYSYTRNGSNVTYTITAHYYVNQQGGWYNNYIGVAFLVAGTEVARGWIKKSTSGSIAYTEGTYTITYTRSITSGTLAFALQVADGAGSGQRFRVDAIGYGIMAVPPAGSTIGTCQQGTTLSGPIINITKYDSSFVDNITLSYNGKTITRNNFTSSKLVFTEAERLSIFQAQGAYTTKPWKLSGTTYSGSTSLGTYSADINIVTENVNYLSATPSFNVEDNSSVTAVSRCGGTYAVYAYLTSSRSSSFQSLLNLSGNGTHTINMSSVANAIYQSNTTSRSGTIYYRTFSYINGTQIGYSDSSCTYNFVQSRCGPSVTSMTYAINDTATKTIMGSTGSNYNYNDSTDIGKFIVGKTTLKIGVTGTAQKSATVSKVYITIPGQANKEVSSASGSMVTAVLNSSGTLSAYSVDSRGFTSTTPLSFTFTLNPYSLPAFNNVSIARNPTSVVDPEQDKYIRLTTTVSFNNYMVASGNVDLKYQYKVAGSSTWSSVQTMVYQKGTSTIYVVDGQLPTAFNQNTQYDFRLVAYDYFTNVTSIVSIIPISAPLLSKRTKMLGVNRVPLEHELEVEGTIYSTNGITTDSYLRSGTNAQIGTYINFETPYTSSNNSCTLKFKRTDGNYDVITIYNGEVFFKRMNSSGTVTATYELLAFEEVSSW